MLAPEVSVNAEGGGFELENRLRNLYFLSVKLFREVISWRVRSINHVGACRLGTRIADLHRELAGIASSRLGNTRVLCSIIRIVITPRTINPGATFLCFI